MEEVCQRFALIAQKILNHVDNETLINFKEAGRTNAAFLGKERFYWIRIIQRYNGLFGELQEVWKKVVRKTSVEVVKEFAIAVHQFSPILYGKFHRDETECLAADKCVCNGTLLSPLDFAQKIEKEWHPLFIGVSSGSANLCNHIIQKASVLQDPTCFNERSSGKITPIVYAADFIENVNVFELLLEKAEYKNPIMFKKNNWTMLHSLAENGSFEMCKSMVGKIQDLSPRNIYGYTPYHIAAINGHEKVCDLLMNLTDTNPKNDSGRTPLDLAALYGHLEVCRLLMEKAKRYVDKKQMDDFLRIPLQWAALKGHVEVVGLFMDNLVNLRDNEGQKIPVLSFKSDDLLLFNSSIQMDFLQSRKLHQTLLLNAIQGGSLNVIELLVEEYKLDVNRSDDFGMTPLHLASKLGKFEICKFLSKYVLDKNTLDSNGQTPYDLAVSENKWDTASFLFSFSLFSMEDIKKSVPQGVTKVTGPDANLGNTKANHPWFSDWIGPGYLCRFIRQFFSAPHFSFPFNYDH
jgi:ankyrin repeat protein